jgi:hypothetical protein
LSVLQQEPNVAAVFGTAKPGATVVVTLAGPGGFSYSSPPTDVTTSPSDPAVHGTWKVLLPARPPGFGYTVTATCADCSNTTRPTLSDVGFGLVFLCSGQSNMEDPVLTTASRNESYAQAATGIYDHIRIFQTGWRLQRESSTWILPQHPDDQQGYVLCRVNTAASIPPSPPLQPSRHATHSAEVAPRGGVGVRAWET